MATVHVGCVLPGMSLLEAPRRRALVERAEETGLDHVGVGDHVSFVVGAGFDGLLGAAGVLSTAERMSANTAVYLLPLRHPVTVARQLADIAAMAPGRFVFGVGIGGEDRHEVQICGVDPATRGRRMDEALQIVRRLLTGSRRLRWEFFSLDEPRSFPPRRLRSRSSSVVAPTRRSGVPAGSATAGSASGCPLPAMPRRSRRWRQPPRTPAAPSRTGSMPSTCGSASMTTPRRRGSTRSGDVGFYGIPYERFERWSPAGTPEQVAEFLVPYAAAGCHVFNLIVNGRSRKHEIEAAAEIRQLMLAAVD